MPADVKTNRKQHLDRQFKRLPPGATVTLQDLLDGTGVYTSDPETVAALLTKHWGDVLCSEQIDQLRLREWLNDVPDQLPNSAHGCWKLDKTHVENAISYAHESAPGPDGIP